ncbi:nucleotidyltransferase domain-containing protein [Agrobacterium rhizogenes]|nr:nucleotidyltransferase domain-containing protein [Rhizobium rhizogenes]
MPPITLPTEHHASVIDAVVDTFREIQEIEAVILTGSCARGQAAPDSDLDVQLLVPNRSNSRKLSKTYTAAWCRVLSERFATESVPSVEIEVSSGRFKPINIASEDAFLSFEIEIGVSVAHAVPLWDPGGAFGLLREAWLPFYDEHLRRKRSVAAFEGMQGSLNKVKSYARRDLHHAALASLHSAARFLLAALFIERRIYPVAYEKWIRWQLENLLGLEGVYAEFSAIKELERLDEKTLLAKVALCERLADRLALGRLNGTVHV